MTTDGNIRAIVDALGLPPGALVDARVPKKLLVEQGAPTPADKRAIQDGIDELQWFAACKPATIGVPAFSDDTRDYLEIAVVGCAFRLAAKTGRLIKLIHRAIPYPAVLITADEGGVAVSAAHKRRAQNEAGRVVLDHFVAAINLHPEALGAVETAFLQSLALAQQPRADLYALYGGWLARIEALNAARLTGAFTVTDDGDAIVQRRNALDAHARLAKEIDTLRGEAKREKQLRRRVDLNTRIQALRTSAAGLMKML